MKNQKKYFKIQDSKAFQLANEAGELVPEFLKSSFFHHN